MAIFSFLACTHTCHEAKQKYMTDQNLIFLRPIDHTWIEKSSFDSPAKATLLVDEVSIDELPHETLLRQSQVPFKGRHSNMRNETNQKKLKTEKKRR